MDKSWHKKHPPEDYEFKYLGTWLVEVFGEDCEKS